MHAETKKMITILFPYHLYMDNSIKKQKQKQKCENKRYPFEQNNNSIKI